MAVIRIPQEIWQRAYDHLFSRPGEHFAFFLADWTSSENEPVFMVRDVLLIADDQITVSRQGCELTTDGIVAVVNAAVRSNSALIEAHNHGGSRPRFSPTDIEGLKEFSRYVLDSLPGRPYGATVWGTNTVFAEYFLPSGKRDIVRSVLVVGSELRQFISRDDDGKQPSTAYLRQLPWFTGEGQQRLGRLRAGVVGLGGIGSQIVQNLTYLGVRDFVLVDDDDADDTNMNRLVTATAADLATPKPILARRLIRSVVPEAQVRVIAHKLQSSEALDALKGMDVLFGCVDNDGARLILNELALAYGVPLFDSAVAIEARDGNVAAAGGRVAVVVRGGPCLVCMGEIDRHEAAFFLGSTEQQADQRARGYVQGLGVEAPSVVSLNAVAAGVAVNEFAVFASGVRAINVYTEFDLLGIGRQTKSQWLVPTRYERNAACVACLSRDAGDASGIRRYARS
jgi:molybdopterin/thiamine biosynthesis adenylyltransferase